MTVVRRTRVEQIRGNLALAAALVHDLGHGPFSSAFEAVGRRLKLKLANHEHVSDLLIREGEVAAILNEMGSGVAVDVADMVKKEGRITVHNAVVSSQFDADRLDYMRRDRLMTGTEHAAIDYTWLMANLEIGSVATGIDERETGSIQTFVIGPKAIHAAEAYVLGLFQLYPTVYFHKATRGAKNFLPNCWCASSPLPEMPRAHPRDLRTSTRSFSSRKSREFAKRNELGQLSRCRYPISNGGCRRPFGKRVRHTAQRPKALQVR